jgi:hypothetical protein
MSDQAGGGQNADEPGALALGQRLIANAFRYRTAKPQETAALRDLRHDAELAPQVTQQLRFLLEGLHRDTNVAYDIQGMSDNGSDVLIRLQSASNASYIGVQIKSHREISDKDLVRGLRDQLSRSEDHYDPLQRWYVFLGADISETSDRKTLQRVRAISAAFSKKPRVTIVDPVYALTFLTLSRAQMNSLTTRTLRVGDPLLVDAIADLTRHPVEAAVLLWLVAGNVTGPGFSVSLEALLASDWLRSIAERTPRQSERYFIDWDGEDDRPDIEELPPKLLHDVLVSAEEESVAQIDWPERLAFHLDRLEDDLEEESDHYQAPVSLHPALYALAAEGRVKHELEGVDLVDYLIDVALNS